MKKRINKFTICFNSDNPNHIIAVNILNKKGRKKADYIAEAIALLERRQTAEHRPADEINEIIDYRKNIEQNSTEEIYQNKNVGKLFNSLSGFRK